MNDLIHLVDERYAVERQIEALENRKKSLNDEIADFLVRHDVKEAYGSDGVGYALSVTTKYKWGKPAFAYLESKGLLAHFSDPKISKSKLEALIKEGVINYKDMAEIDKYCQVEQSPYTLRKVIEKAVV